MRYAQQALRLSRQHKMLRGEGFAKLKEADILVQQSSTAKVNNYMEEATRIATQLRDSFMLALATYQQGQSMMYQDQYAPQAEKLYLKALSLYFEKHLSSYTGLVYNDMGYMFGIQGELEQQAKWLLKSMRVYEQLEDLPGLATATSNMASVYHSLGNKEEAMSYTKQAITMREKIGDIAGLATSYSNLSLFYRAVSIDSSIKYQEIATRYATKTGIKAKMIDGYDNMSVLMNMQKRKAEALEYIKKSIPMCSELSDNLGLAHKTRWAALLMRRPERYHRGNGLPTRSRTNTRSNSTTKHSGAISTAAKPLTIRTRAITGTPMTRLGSIISTRTVSSTRQPKPISPNCKRNTKQKRKIVP